MSKKEPPVAGRALELMPRALAVSLFHLGIRKDNMSVFLRGTVIQVSQS